MEEKIYLRGQDLFYIVYTFKNRTIYAPSTNLRCHQKIFLEYIKTVYKLNFKTKNAAKVHCKQKWILKTDIKNFYESFSKIQIKNAIDILCKRLKSEYQMNVSREEMFHYCTIDGKLPTGALTSAHLASFAFELIGIDKTVIDFCKKYKIHYSRYMDDLTFSSDDKNKLQSVKNFIQQILSENGFSLNNKKTKYICNNMKQEVLGILVNNKEPRISKINRRKIRSIIYNYFRSIYLKEYYGEIDIIVQKAGFEIITGHMSYLKETDSEYYEKMKEYIRTKSEKLKITNTEEVRKLYQLYKIEDYQLNLFK